MEPRFTFDRIAGLYDAVRAGYPDAVFDTLAASVPPGARMLEVGCGTGKATVGFAARGLAIVALDPGPAMIAEARASLADRPNVRFAQGTFEDWTAEGAPFALIAAAQAWHWVPPEVGFPKAAALLAPGGTLAIFGNIWAPADADLLAAIDAIYLQKAPTARGSSLAVWYEPSGPIPALFEASGLFTPAVHRQFDWRRTLTVEAYVDMLRTLSNHQGLEPEALDDLLDTVSRVARDRGPSLDLNYATHLHTAQRR